MRAQRNPRKQFPGPERTAQITKELNELSRVVDGMLQRMHPNHLKRVVEWLVHYAEVRLPPASPLPPGDPGGKPRWVAGKLQPSSHEVAWRSNQLNEIRAAGKKVAGDPPRAGWQRVNRAISETIQVLYDNGPRYKRAPGETALLLLRALLDAFQHTELATEPYGPEPGPVDLGFLLRRPPGPTRGSGPSTETTMAILRSKMVGIGRLVLLYVGKDVNGEDFFWVNWYLPVLGRSAFTEEGKTVYQENDEGMVIPLGAFDDKREAIEFYEAHTCDTLWTEDYLVPDQVEP